MILPALPKSVDVDSAKRVNGRVPQIVTFSGIDGAGKTTQIDLVSVRLTHQGYRVACVTFWDDVAFMSKLRAGVSLTVLRKRQSREGATLRNDKNVQTWYLMVVRVVFYLLDALCLRHVVSQLRNGDHDFVIFDRYLYDQLAQIRTRRGPARAYIRLLLELAPKPDFAFLLDASPDEAFTRKPEYPLDFMYSYRRAFLSLRAFVPQLTVIGPSSLEEVQHSIWRRLSEASDGVVPGRVLGARADASQTSVQ